MTSGVYIRNKPVTVKTRKKLSMLRIGKKHSAETKKKISLATKCQHKDGRVKLRRKGEWYPSNEAKEKNRIAHLGKKQSKITIDKRRKAMIGKRWFVKDTSKMGKSQLGKKASNETRLKMSIAKSGKNNYNWIEDRNFLIYPDGWTDTLKESIRQRGGYVCQECGIHQDELERRLDVHHIDYNKNNCNPDNLVALCRSCHIKTNSNRDYWLIKFNFNE